MLLLFNFLHKLIHTIVINAATAAAAANAGSGAAAAAAAIDVFTFDD